LIYHGALANTKLKKFQNIDGSMVEFLPPFDLDSSMF